MGARDRLASSVIMFFLSAVLAGCFDSHGRHRDAGAGGGEASLRDGSGRPLPGCTTSTGAWICDIADCPVNYPGCPLCMGPSDAPVGYCTSARYTGCTVGGCFEPNTLCFYEPDGGTSLGVPIGTCFRKSACEDWWIHGYTPPCIYDDSTPYTGRPLASEPCDPSLRGIACGPGCGACAEGQCWGVSEQHGIGACVDATLDNPGGYRKWCGAFPPYGGGSCDASESCLRIKPPNPVPPGFAADRLAVGFCVPQDHCQLLSTAFPDRFSCR